MTSTKQKAEILDIKDEIRPPPETIIDSLASGGGILCAGLPRTGTFSLAVALDKLGYKHVHHVIRYSKLPDQWYKIEDCSKRHYPYLNQGPGESVKPYTKEEWDNWIGQFQATTDLTPFFCKELIQTYPNAKVILVTRDFDKWVTSLETTLFYFVFGWVYILDAIADGLSGHHSTIGLKAMMRGFFQADSTMQAKINARKVYDEHHAMVRAMVPKENLLEYNYADGWEPLCEFLGKPVPAGGEKFPRANESDWLLSARFETRILKSILGVAKALKVGAPLIFAGVGWKLAQRYAGGAGSGMASTALSTGVGSVWQNVTTALGF